MSVEAITILRVVAITLAVVLLVCVISQGIGSDEE
jgi:hypothetical protein